MPRTTALRAPLALLPIVLALGACGDDGGDGGTAAFCDAAESVQGDANPSVEEVEELADAAPDSLDDDFDILLDFLRAAEDGDVDALEGLDDDDLSDAGNAVADVAREECGIDLDGTDDAGDDAAGTTTTAGDPGGADDTGAASAAPTSGDPVLDQLAAQCEEGDFAACDDLFAQTPVGSEQEAYGATCGGRLGAEDASPSGCEARFG